MLVGECKKCGERYFGWALSMADQQTCSECGSKLAICNDARDPDFESTGLSPTVENHTINRTLPNVTSVDRGLGNIEF